MPNESFGSHENGTVESLNSDKDQEATSFCYNTRLIQNRILIIVFVKA